MSIVAGLDIGSLSTKTVIIDENNRILSHFVLLTTGDGQKAGEECYKKALQLAKLSKDKVNYIITTGYGRDNISFADKEVTEITAHAKGAHFLYPDTRTVLDIGGQDSKAINLDHTGQVIDFIMNDKCAAGTGRFIEVMAHALGISLEKLSELSRQSTNPAIISSFCTVFAESEVVSLVADRRSKADIVRGIHEAIAERTYTLLNKIKVIEPITMTGGVAKNRGVVNALEHRLKLKLSVPDEPQIVGALGAALIALKSILKKGDFSEINKKS